MRAYALQQRTIWHPRTNAQNSTFIPASSAPAGLPERITTVRLLQRRDARDPALDLVPLAKATQIVVSVYVLHNPQCQATNHVTMNVNLAVSKDYGPAIDWPSLEVGRPEYSSWTLVKKSRNLIDVSKDFNTGYVLWTINQVKEGLCSYYIADDRITLTP